MSPAAVFLDSTPLNLACRPRGEPAADACRAWLFGLLRSGVRVVVPEVADYEVRREMVRAGASARLRDLDELGERLAYLPISTAAMRRAAEFWASARNAGLPTADRHALDGDAILAAQATTALGDGQIATIATGNVGHLLRFPGVDARGWEQVGIG